MSSIAIGENVFTVSGATSKGELTVSSNDGAYPGTFAWLSLTNGSASTRVQIVKLVGSTKIWVRGAPDGTEASIAQPSYGFKDVSAYNGGGFLFVEAQTAPINWAHSIRNGG